MEDYGSPLSKALADTLAGTFAFYARAHASHWNVTGAGFPQYHEMFKDIYEDAHGAVDPLAENLRKLGEMAPCCLHEMSEIAGDEREPDGTDGLTLAADLMLANTELLGKISVAIDAAAKANDQGLLNLLAERQDMHKKWDWQLKSTMQGKGVTKRDYDPEKRRMRRLDAYTAGAATGAGLAATGAALTGARGARQLRAEGRAVRSSAQDLRTALRSAAMRSNPGSGAALRQSAKGSLRAVQAAAGAAKATKKIRRAGKLTAVSAGLGGAAIYLDRKSKGSARPYESWMDGKKPRKRTTGQS